MHEEENKSFTFLLGIYCDFEGVLSKINFGNIDPLTVDVVFVDVVAANRNALKRTTS